VAQDNNTNKFNWLTNEQKKDQINHLKKRISSWEKKIKETEQSIRNLNSKTINRRNRRAIRRTGKEPTTNIQEYYQKNILAYKLNISNWLIKIKEIEDTM